MNCNYIQDLLNQKMIFLNSLDNGIDNDIESLYEIVAQQDRRHMIWMTTDLQQNGAPLETAPQ